MILVANPFQHLFHLANNRLGGHNLNLTTKAKYPAKELWADSNRDFCVRRKDCAAKPAKLSTDSAEIEQAFRAG